MTKIVNKRFLEYITNNDQALIGIKNNMVVRHLNDFK